MGLGLIDYIVMCAGSVALVAWLIFFFIGLKHNPFFEVLDEKDYPLKEIYGLGYAVLELIKYGYKTKGDRKLRQQLEILYEEKYSDYYLRVIHAQQITWAFTMFVLSFALYGLTSEIIALLLGFMFSGLAYYYFGTVTKKKILKRSDEMIHDFSEVVSKLALLTNAGLILKEAWEVIAFEGEGVIYSEMQRAVEEMKNGVSDVDAIYSFGTRCMLPEIKKFTSTILPLA